MLYFDETTARWILLLAFCFAATVLMIFEAVVFIIPTWELNVFYETMFHGPAV